MSQRGGCSGAVGVPEWQKLRKESKAAIRAAPDMVSSNDEHVSYPPEPPPRA
jgi:hypothetical protein